MYYLYHIKKSDKVNIYQRIEQTKLFGCNVGMIPKILRNIIPPDQNEIYKWKINLEKDLPKIGINDSCIIIDAKPNKSDNVSLYKIENIFGYSSSGWTPMMLHLKALLVDNKGEEESKNNFEINNDKEEDVFTFVYVFNGSTIKQGTITGKWVPSRPSSINSALLLKPVFDYFIECENEITRK
jgi:hypothetical protein